MELQPYQDLIDASAAFAGAKIAYTKRLGELAAKFNNGQAVNAADLADLIVNFYDPMTFASNALRGQVATLKRFLDSGLGSVGNEVGVFDAYFGNTVNILIGTGTRDAALDVAEKYHADLVNEINGWFETGDINVSQMSFTAEKALADYYGQPAALYGWTRTTPPALPPPPG